MTQATGSTMQDDEIQAWPDDPGTPEAPHATIARPRPNLDDAPLRVRIDAPDPSAANGATDTPEFRYWNAADALRRASDMWGATIGDDARWFESVGDVLPVELDAGVDLNAYYDREALRFFHAQVNGTTLFSGESPDVVCHEHGHAVLDSLRPELFDSPFAETAAFHEAFGDMSSMLCALHLDSVRDGLLASTHGRIHRNSSVSRLAEQLGWAIRRDAPDAVDHDALRNAANSWFYRDAADLPPSAPASELSSEPHSYSRVFTGAFLHALSGMLSTHTERTSAALLEVAQHAGSLLRDAVVAAPVVPAYMSHAAAEMLAADADAFGGRYRDALTGAFLRHGILSVPAATRMTGPAAEPSTRSAGVAPATQVVIQRIALPAAAFGLPADLIVPTPYQARRVGVAGARADLGSIEPPAPERAAASFVEDLFRRGRIGLDRVKGVRAALDDPVALKTHDLYPEDDGLVLKRRLFDCGMSEE